MAADVALGSDSPNPCCAELNKKYLKARSNRNMLKQGLKMMDARLDGFAQENARLKKGGLFGYVVYDCTHYYLHHGQPSKDPAKSLKRYHMNHHYKIQTMGFRITSSVWDSVFGTLPLSSGGKSSGKST